jgi:DnaJ domain
MPLYLGLGTLALAIVLLILRAFVRANPAQLARGVRAGLIAAGLALIWLLLFLGSYRLGLGLIVIGYPLWFILRRLLPWFQSQGGPSPGPASEVETDYLRMRLDHETGAMSGTVRRGSHKGRDLGELSRAELVALWRECRAEDAQGGKLLEAYLDRLAPDWREAGEAGGTGNGGRASAAADAMSRDEAFAVLGLATGAGEAEIREAYHRLMKKIHPDQGGSAYLAAKLNRAREMLLG